MRTGLNPLWNGFLGNAAFAVAERTHVSAGITPDTFTQLSSPKFPPFFDRLGVDVCCVTIPLFNVDLWLFDRVANHNVTSLRIALLTDGTFMRQRISLAGAWDAYQYDVFALDYMLAQENVYGPQITTLDNNSDLTHTAYGVFGQIHGEITETTVIEHKTFDVLRLTYKLRMRKRRLSVSAVPYDNANIKFREQFRGCTLERFCN